MKEGRWNSNKYATPAEYFWANVSQVEGKCWPWLGCTSKKGYGVALYAPDFDRCPASKLAWFIATGEVPTEQMLHTCDNPICVRFDHLFEGTNADNVADKVAKGRQAQGSEFAAKLHHSTTEEQAREVLRLSKLGWWSSDIVALMPELTYIQVRNIRRGKSWRYLQ